MNSKVAPTWTREQLMDRVVRSPFNEWLELELVDWDAGSITLRLKSRRELYGHATLGSLHGGIIASLIDACCSLAVVTRTGESVVTVDMRVDYLRPATAADFQIRGEVVRIGRTLATADAQVIGPDGMIVASGRAVLQHVPLVPG